MPPKMLKNIPACEAVELKQLEKRAGGRPHCREAAVGWEQASGGRFAAGQGALLPPSPVLQTPKAAD